MADAVTVEVNSAGFEAALRRLDKAVRSGFVDPIFGTLPKQASLLALRCQDFTPPIARGKAGFPDRVSARKAGEIAIKRDLHRCFWPVSQSTFESKSLKRIVSENNVEAWRIAAMRFKKPELRNTTAFPSFNAVFHTANRNNRGRVVRAKNGYNLGRVSLGPVGVEARAYTKKMLDRQGWARAGWNLGVLAGGTGMQAHAGLPNWVRRHGLGQGAYTDGTASADPFVRVSNNTGWAKYGSGEGNRIISNAIGARIRDMEKYAEKMAQVAAQRAVAAA